MLNGIAWAEPGRPDGAPDHNRVVKDRLCALVTRAHGLGDLLASRILDQSVEQDLRSYDGLLQSYADDQDVMPMRFGTCVATLDDVQDLLGRHEVTSTNWLRSFAGRREFAVRVQRETDPSLQVEPHADGGRSYLARQLASRKAVEQSRERTKQFLFRTQMTLERYGVLQKLAKVPSAEHRIAG
ncbi:MAG: GvpL/GvpF family gas vesicle protein, partial [Pseudomonadota bacterium]